MSPITCMSSDSHEATDNLTHYLGCVQLNGRKTFYENLPEEAKIGIQTELRRISYLREILKSSDSEEDRQFVKSVHNSFKEWKQKHRTNIDKISRRRGRGTCEEHDPNPEKKNKNTDPYHPDKDLKAYSITFCNGEGVTDDTEQPGKPGRPGKTLCHGKFPNQKIVVEDLLRHPNSPLKHSHDFRKDEKRVRYFHLPSNNMKWVEAAIAKYYDQTDTKYDTAYNQAEKRTEANTLLHRDLWLRQEHGRDSSIVHARHMKPLCEIVSSDPNTKDLRSQPRNMVMFMPYLHWDLDRQRKNFASLVEKRAARHHDELRAEETRKFKERQKVHYDVHNLDNEEENANEQTGPHMNVDEIVGSHPSRVAGRRETQMSTTSGRTHLPDFVSKFMRQRIPTKKSTRKRQISRGKFGRLEIDNSLGQLLYDAAKLFEVMGNFRDRRLLDEYLLADPPIHPRRTLDQAHYWSLRNTKIRDRDQVVYRQTSVNPDQIHHYYPSEKKGKQWDCAVKGFRGANLQRQNSALDHEGSQDAAASDQTRSASLFGSQGAPSLFWHQSSHNMADKPRESQNSESWLSRSISLMTDLERGTRDGEGDGGDNRTRNSPQTSDPQHQECLDCREAIQKVPRLIMVDQLWMWILDDETILTCFPRRYGVNRKDNSGVFRSIRMRLGNIGTGRIQTAYDVALCIIDECCNVFFDRTKTDDRQPPVIDIFSESISKVAHKQVIYSEHLWHWADELAKASTKKSSWFDLSNLHKALLNITPEGKLQRETKDIIEELHIMIGIIKKQKEVLKRFRRHGEFLLDRNGDFRDSHNNEPMLGSIGSPPGISHKYTTSSFESQAAKEHAESRYENWKNFTSHADRLLMETDDRLEELEILHHNAGNICKDIDNLLAMKQQQASVVQAWQAIRHGEEAVKQGRAIMIFTVITIVFLPLAFMAAIFGMNNTALADDKMSMNYQLKLIFSISIGVIVLVIIVVFSSFIRSLFWCATYFCVNWLAVKTGIYGLWLSLPDVSRPKGLVLWSERKVESMRQKVRKRVRQKGAQKIRQRKKQQNEKEKAEKEEKAQQNGGQGPGLPSKGHVSTGGAGLRRLDNLPEERQGAIELSKVVLQPHDALQSVDENQARA